MPMWFNNVLGSISIYFNVTDFDFCLAFSLCYKKFSLALKTVIIEFSVLVGDYFAHSYSFSFTWFYAP